MAIFITHGVFASSLLFLWRKKEVRVRLFLLIFLASVLPDIDLLFPNANRVFSHRGITHSFFFALMTGALFSAILLSEIKNFFEIMLLFLIFFLTSCSHILLDLMTDAPLGVCYLCPFSEERIFFPFKPFNSYSGGLSTGLTSRGVGNIWRFIVPEMIYVWIPSIIFFSFALFIERKTSPQKKSNQNSVTFKPIKINRTDNKSKNIPKKNTPKKK
jgi:inner membrane protein